MAGGVGSPTGHALRTGALERGARSPPALLCEVLVRGVELMFFREDRGGTTSGKASCGAGGAGEELTGDRFGLLYGAEREEEGDPDGALRPSAQEEGELLGSVTDERPHRPALEVSSAEVLIALFSFYVVSTAVGGHCPGNGTRCHSTPYQHRNSLTSHRNSL